LYLCFYSRALLLDLRSPHTTTGTVQGDVLDERGGSVAGATVEARNLDTNFAQTEKTNSDGHFAFLNLAPAAISSPSASPALPRFFRKT